MTQEIPQPTPIADINSVNIAKWAPGGSVLARCQLTTPGWLQARTLISTMMATVGGTVYFSKVRMA